MDFPLYFQKVMLLWQRSIVEIDYGFFRVFGPYFIGKSLGTFKILIFGLWSFIPHPYQRGWSLCEIIDHAGAGFYKPGQQQRLLFPVEAGPYDFI
jgi:hypothetical protein